jgi:glycosyltransferase involved in cell wall biosynthesis
MKKKTLVSVIVPAFNCEKTISETLLSLINQDYEEIEIVVVNDGSTDNTLNILKSFGNKIRLFDQKNAGVSSARNAGLQKANGEYISFCDSDDIWAHQKVTEQVKYLKSHPSVGMVYTDWYVWIPDEANNFIIPDKFISNAEEEEEEEEEQQIITDRSGWIYTKLLLDCICLTSTVMLTRETIVNVGFFDPELCSGEDYDYWIRVSRITEIHKLKAKRVLYRMLSHSLANTPTNIHYEYEVLKKAVGKWGLICLYGGGQLPVSFIQYRFANMRFSFGYLHFNSGNPSIAMKCFWDVIKYRPFRYKAWVYLIMAWYKQIKRKIK